MRLRAMIQCLFFASAAGILTPVVEVQQGRLRGLRSVSGQNRYYGIPYATSKRFRVAELEEVTVETLSLLLGALSVRVEYSGVRMMSHGETFRLSMTTGVVVDETTYFDIFFDLCEPPEPPPKWAGTFNAVYPFGACTQIVASFIFGREDCQQLDVYAPEGTTSRDKLPVLVFFHGGAYYYGSKWHYDPEFLVTKNVVAVIVNYRMGIFGFLCINGISNLGLKDQTAALKWIQRNIAAFGGDPDNVTVSGQSAGASAAAMHMLSKSSAGLFHKAILLSGNPLAPWAFNVEPAKAALEDASKIRPIENEEDAFEVFATATVNEILNVTADTSINPRRFKYAPCLDAHLSEPFFHDTPFATLNSGNFNKVPIISGFASAEGGLFYGLHDDKTLKELNENFSEKLPSVFSWCPTNKELITEKFRAHYFSDISGASMRGVVKFYSDWMAYATADAFANIITEHSDQPMYNYIFTYEGDRNFAKSIFGRGSPGASHSDDVFYVFKPAGLPLLLSSRDKLLIDRLTTMFTNFMKFGNPTPKRSQLLRTQWPASTTNHSVSMLLDNPMRVVATPATHQGRYFRQLLCQYGLQGFVPCKSRMECGTLNEI